MGPQFNSEMITIENILGLQLRKFYTHYFLFASEVRALFQNPMLECEREFSVLCFLYLQVERYGGVADMLVFLNFWLERSVSRS